MDKASQMKENIKRSKELRNQQMKYNGFATLTALTAIASYVGAAVTLEADKRTLAITFLVISIANNLGAIYSLTKAAQKGREAMNALKHDINTKVK